MSSSVTRWDDDELYASTIVTDNGTKIDTTAPTWPWADLIGRVEPKTAAGVGTPTYAAYNGANLYGYWFALNDVSDFVFHIPHDYARGTDIFIHVHWSHNGTAISGTASFTFHLSFAKGHNQEAFPAEKSPVVSYNTVDIAATPRYRHRVDEIRASQPGGSASLLDTDAIEVDGLILGRIKLTSLPTIVGGNLFIHTVDIHYQTTNVGTKNKAPNFYG